MSSEVLYKVYDAHNGRMFNASGPNGVTYAIARLYCAKLAVAGHKYQVKKVTTTVEDFDIGDISHCIDIVKAEYEN